MTFLYFAWFGVMALLIGLMTSRRWPLAAWTLVAALAAIDYSTQPFWPQRAREARDPFAEGLGAARLVTAVPKDTRGRNRDLTKTASKDGGY